MFVLLLVLGGTTGWLWPILHSSPAHADVSQQQQPSLSAVFDWSMPDRFGLDEDGDGLIDYFPTADEISPSGWRVNFDACASRGSISLYEWSVGGDLVNSATQCQGFAHTFPDEGAYNVKLVVLDQSNNNDSVSNTVVVLDWLIVGIGDSFGSGEGNPDIPISQDEWDVLEATWGPVKAAFAVLIEANE